MSGQSIQTSFLGEMNDVFCQQQCFAYAKCGGGYETAPCQCAWKTTSKRYLQCHKCYLVCLRRLVAVKGRPVDSARPQYKAGLDLGDFTMSQELQENFPLFIPTRTADFPVEGGVLPLQWAAADATQLKERILTGPASVPKFANLKDVQAFLRVTGNCRLMAIMNAQDKILEKFWALDDRIGKFQRMASYGFELSTGATFSVVERTLENTFVPRFHNLVMQRRHHRTLSEIYQAGLTAVPNLYWLDDREEGVWVKWLLRNSTVHYLSRDFTRTRKGSAFEEVLNSLLNLLIRTGRVYHIFLVGPGPAVAAHALQRLAEHGHTGTILTSDPIMQGISGKLYNSEFKAMPFRAKPRHELVLENIEAFETHLLDAVANTEAARTASRNLVLNPKQQDAEAVQIGGESNGR